MPLSGGILVRAPLLWAVGVREVHPTSQKSLHGSVMSELETVVERDGVYGKTTKGDLDMMRDQVRLQRANLPHNAEPGRAVDQSEKGVARVVFGAVHQVALPIARATPFLDGRWPFRDVPLVGLPKAPFCPVRHARFALEAQIRLAALPPPVNPVIYRLVAHRPHMTNTPHVPGNLFWREGILEQLFEVAALDNSTYTQLLLDWEEESRTIAAKRDRHLLKGTHRRIQPKRE